MSAWLYIQGHLDECRLEGDPIGFVCRNTRSALCLGRPGQAWDKTFQKAARRTSRP